MGSIAQYKAVLEAPQSPPFSDDLTFVITCNIWNWNQSQWPLDDLWLHTSWVVYRLCQRIIVYKSHENTFIYMDVLIIFFFKILIKKVNAVIWIHCHKNCHGLVDNLIYVWELAWFLTCVDKIQQSLEYLWLNAMNIHYTFRCLFHTTSKHATEIRATCWQHQAMCTKYLLANTNLYVQNAKLEQLKAKAKQKQN